MSLRHAHARRLFLARSPSGLIVLSLLVAACSLSACSSCTEDDNPPDPPRPSNNTTNKDASADGDIDMGDDVGTDTGGDAGPDAEGPDGVMAGTWLVNRLEEDGSQTLQVTLELRHKAGDSDVTGTYLLAVGPTTPAALDSASWRNERFNAAWSARIDGIGEDFQIDNARIQSTGYLLGYYLDSRLAAGIDVSIEQVEEN